MKKHCVKFYFSLISFLLIQVLTHAQPNPTYQLTIESGGYVEFKVYSLQHYNNGLTYTDFTTLRINYKDTNSTIQTDEWYLGVKAQDSEFLSDYPSESLSLDYVTLEAIDGGGIDSFNSGEIVTGEISLNSTSFEPIVIDGDEGNYKLNLTYHLDSVTGRYPAYYNTNLIFKMDTVPFPW